MAAGSFPPADGSVDLGRQPAGRSAAVLGFTGHHVVAADVEPSWVAAHADPADVGWPLTATFLSSLGLRLGRGPGILDVVLVADGLPGPPAIDLVPLHEGHPRRTRALQYRWASGPSEVQFLDPVP